MTRLDPDRLYYLQRKALEQRARLERQRAEIAVLCEELWERIDRRRARGEGATEAESGAKAWIEIPSLASASLRPAGSAGCVPLDDPEPVPPQTSGAD
ncbi:MAG: hypothetical protein JO306_11140 [Gemmatimonadetes bacterium]|nr:hypothetical protein [Gemmatimonadota bacterium]